MGKWWTQEEKDLLAELWGTYSVGAIARRLGRSEYAVKIKAKNLRLGGHLAASDMISLNELFKCFGYQNEQKYKMKNLEAVGFPVHLHKVRNNSFRMVDIDEFWEFAEKNRHLFDFSRLEENILGAEPEWVKEKRREDFKRARAVKPNHTEWTEPEERELIRLLREYRYTCREIAARLNRTEGAVQRRIQDLGLKERPVAADKTIRWTDEEFQTIGRMIKAGSSYENMSQAVGKSAKAIRGRVYAMYLTENLSKVAKIIGDGEWGDNRPERPISYYKTMTIEEKEQTKAAMSRLAGLLTYRIRQHYDDQDNWQRNLCQHWDEVKGCTAGCVNCDECDQFERIRPQNCVRCGVTFYERKENRKCERCRKQIKNQKAYKYIKAKERGKA